MKKLLRKLVVGLLTVACLAGATACSGEVKNGSKLDYLTVTFDIDGEEKSVVFDLYLNFAPGTIDHVKYLVSEGYYTNTVVSNVNKHIEFGEYEIKDGEYVSKYSDNASLSYVSVIKDYATQDKFIGSARNYKRYFDDDNKLFDGYAIRGEFEQNGVKNNKLDLSSGALVLKRDIGDKSESSDMNAADTARATLAVTFGSDSYYDDATAFAVIGKVRDSADVTELKKLLEDDYKKEDGNIEYRFKGNYYMLKSDGKYYEKDARGEYTVELDDESDIVEDINDNSKLLEIVPVKTVTVKSVKIGK